jgi:hypothetical protein
VGLSAKPIAIMLIRNPSGSTASVGIAERTMHGSGGCDDEDSIRDLFVLQESLAWSSLAARFIRPR